MDRARYCSVIVLDLLEFLSVDFLFSPRLGGDVSGAMVGYF